MRSNCITKLKIYQHFIKYKINKINWNNERFVTCVSICVDVGISVGVCVCVNVCVRVFVSVCE